MTAAILFGHGSCWTFELLHLDAGPSVGDQSFQFYKAGRTATSHASLHNVAHFFNNTGQQNFSDFLLHEICQSILDHFLDADFKSAIAFTLHALVFLNF